MGQARLGSRGRQCYFHTLNKDYFLIGQFNFGILKIEDNQRIYFPLKSKGTWICIKISCSNVWKPFEKSWRKACSTSLLSIYSYALYDISIRSSSSLLLRNKSEMMRNLIIKPITEALQMLREQKQSIF